MPTPARGRVPTGVRPGVLLLALIGLAAIAESPPADEKPPAPAAAAVAPPIAAPAPTAPAPAVPTTVPVAPEAHAAPPVATVPPSAVAPDYIIGPGDVLHVFVWRNPELSVQVPVRPDGRISTPLVEDMTAVGKTPSALARDIEKVLGEYIRSPQVNIIVVTPVGMLGQVKAIGQVKAPQGVAFREGMRVLDLLLASGGMTEFAAGNRAKLVRRDGAKSTELKVRLVDLVNKGDMKQNLELKAGDVLIVPESRF